ncbi:uncharacterized protein [Triticum aestivum]|uniref:uncharacterized protein n=1 Tax=Triticum aestivum TaxID=4565 RepID=UPI001D008247|nr:uncharacterized protein LOC123112608 [Triticum aestivum]
MEERNASLHRFNNWKPRTHSAKGQKINQLSRFIILQAGTSELEIGHNFQLHKEDAQKRIWALASRITRSKIHTNNSDSIPDGGRSKRRPLVHSPPFSPWMRMVEAAPAASIGTAVYSGDDHIPAANAPPSGGAPRPATHPGNRDGQRACGAQFSPPHLGTAVAFGSNAASPDAARWRGGQRWRRPTSVPRRGDAAQAQTTFDWRRHLPS